MKGSHFMEINIVYFDLYIQSLSWKNNNDDAQRNKHYDLWWREEIMETEQELAMMLEFLNKHFKITSRNESSEKGGQNKCTDEGF